MPSRDSEELAPEIAVERAHIINDGRENFIEKATSLQERRRQRC
jgi:hypothetical protein